MFLVQNLDAKHSLLVNELYQAKVLNEEETVMICSELTSFKQNTKLLWILRSKTKDEFEMFLDLLDKTGQQRVRSRITGRQRMFIAFIRL